MHNNKNILKEENLRNNNKEEIEMAKNWWEKKSTESKWVLIIALTLILYFVNTSKDEIIKNLSNFWLSISSSIIAVILWYFFTEK